MTASTIRDDRAAVDKAVSLLASFGDQAGAELGVSELARRAGLSKSTAFRLLGVLERNGIVEKVGRKYRLGGRLHDLGRQVYVPDHDRIRDALIPFLADLYEMTRETVHLAALHGTDALYLSKLHGHRPVRSPSRIGGRVPAYCTAVGKALLAYDHEALELLLAGELRPLTPNTIIDPDRLVAEIADVRHAGVAFDDEEAAPGLSCVAVPVLGPGCRAVAAISVSTVTGRLDTRAQVPALRRVSAAAAQHLMRVRRRRPAPPVRAIA